MPSYIKSQRQHAKFWILLSFAFELHASQISAVSEVVASAALSSLAVDDVHDKWPWKSALGKFASVQPDKRIWFVHPKKHLQSIVILRLKRLETVNFKYRSDSSTRISVDFSAGGRFLTDIAVTAAGFDAPPLELNHRFREKSQEAEQLFVLGLARAERRGPEGFNRLEECSEHLRRQLDVEMLEEYCQIMLIGVLSCPRQSLNNSFSQIECSNLQQLFHEAAMSHGKTGGATRLLRPGQREIRPFD